MPEVSVIIPSYNHAPFLKERIESVLQQSYTDMEVIILDDASTDSSRQIIEEYRHHPLVKHIILNQQNSGSPFRQWAKGLSKAAGKWIWIAESDDKAVNYFLERMVKDLRDLAEKNITPAFVFCDSLIVQTGSTAKKTFADLKNERLGARTWGYDYNEKGKLEINNVLKWDCSVNNASAVLFNKELLEKRIPAIQDYRYHGDWMLYILMAEQGYVSYIHTPMNIYREHEKNHSASDKYQRQFKIEHFRILDHLLRQEYVTEKDRLFRHFLDHYIGFGFLKEPAFGKKGIYRHYRAINSKLARKTVGALLLNKLKRKKTG